MSAITTSCNTKYHATRQSGTRPISDIKLIVMHDTEGGTAQSNARYFASKDARGSAHLVVDDDNCYRTLRNDEIPWAAPYANTQGFHIEQCAYAAWTKAEWLKHEDMLDRAAYKAALHCHYFKIPPRFVYAAGLRAGRKGITTHAEVSKAWPNALGNHHDPGTGWPRDYFMALVRQHYNALRDEDL